MGYQIQDENENAKVKVNAGTHHATGQPQTDFIISEPGYPNEHTHIVFDEYGREVYNEPRPNH